VSDQLRPSPPGLPDIQKDEAITAWMGRLTARRGPFWHSLAHGNAAPQDGWFARAAMSGFVAAFVMLAGFASAYGGALLLDRVLSSDGYGVATLGGWVHALTHNSVLDLGQANLYIAVATYFGGGLLWALVYGRFVEPRLSGVAWSRGLRFGLAPAVVSLVVAMPLLGGSILGLGLGAGPLPALGTLLLHALYGATLGLIYGPYGDVSADTLQPDTIANHRLLAHAERTAAGAGLAGGLLGVATGLGVVLATGPNLTGGLGVPPAAFALATGLAGIAVGALVGSLVGLPSSDSDEPTDRQVP
jgi:hypothetical protein